MTLITGTKLIAARLQISSIARYAAAGGADGFFCSSYWGKWDVFEDGILGKALET
jgi:hypothetical protein